MIIADSKIIARVLFYIKIPRLKKQGIKLKSYMKKPQRVKLIIFA